MGLRICYYITKNESKAASRPGRPPYDEYFLASMQSHQEHRLPVELYQKIFEEISIDFDKQLPEYYHTIKACRATCKLLYQITTPLLFRYGVALASQIKQKPLERPLILHTAAAQLIQNSPALEHSIRHVSLTLPEETPLNFIAMMDELRRLDPTFKEPILEDPTEWPDDSPFLNLPALRSLELNYQISSSYSWDFMDYFSSSWRSRACSTLLNRYLYTVGGALTTLSMTHMSNLPIHPLLESPTLAHLKLHGCTATRLPSIDHCHDSPIGRNIKRYEAFHCDEILSIQVLSHLVNIQRCEVVAEQHRFRGYTTPPEVDREDPVVFSELTHLSTTLPLSYILGGFMLSKSQTRAFPALKKLKFPMASTVREMLTEYVGNGHIEELNITNDVANVSPSSILYLQDGVSYNRHTLKHLSFELSFDTSSTIGELIKCFDCLQADNVLQTLQFKIHLLLPAPSFPSGILLDSPINPRGMECWTRLSHLLADGMNFPDLKRMCVDVEVIQSAFHPGDSHLNLNRLDKSKLEAQFAAHFAPLREYTPIEFSFSLKSSREGEDVLGYGFRGRSCCSML
ncbi:hypothetical protein CVT24_009659 [Panaeolus cyanescens]|uniref:F-box domain-containing protein n=1 Tax=Panaeolus cyanescens TaxID=181874 RepID=A0A409Y9W0_9AGAR|nr:hypothetical protein CVT24_009659 [Panaeolus cyanescens]